MPKKFLLFILIVSAIGLYAACQRKPEDAIARVGKHYISEKEFQQKIKEISSQYQSYINTSNGRQQFLDILIREKLMLAAAEASGVRSMDEFRKETRQTHEDMEIRYKEFEQYLMTKMWIEKLKKDGVLSVTEREIKEYHSKYPYQVSLSHILSADAEEAEKILRKVKSGRNFASVAKEESIDRETAPDGGKIPPFIIGEFLPELENAGSNMKTGEVQGVFRSRFGYHILKKNGEDDITLDNARERIDRILQKTKLDKYLEGLQEKYKVEVLDADKKKK